MLILLDGLKILAQRDGDLKVCPVVIVPPVLFWLKNDKINGLDLLIDFVCWPLNRKLERTELRIDYVSFEVRLDGYIVRHAFGVLW